ncbi:MAG: insulinase family protein [Gammaproteobacteria bacterium]|nr:insulinase family protein [Gammaproteobacteria bacterium]
MARHSAAPAHDPRRPDLHALARIRQCLLILCLPLAAAAAEPAQEFTLPNGLKLIVQEDHRAPVAVVQVWYKIGSSYEHDGTTGLSHALEHMMFKGTKHHPPGAFSRIVAARGGKENAFTTTDYTAYFEQWAASNVELSFDLEADRMRNLTFDEQDFAKEMKVIMEERHMRTDDNPQALASEVVDAVAFLTSPYRHPVIGWQSDLESMRLEDLRAWYARWYAPNNAIVVVVGDVEPAKVHALAQKHFGPLAKQLIPPTKPRTEPEQRGMKRLTFKSESATLPYLMMAYKAPVLVEALAKRTNAEPWEIYALDVLSETLDGDQSSRLTRNLVRGRQIAAQVESSYAPASRLESLFSFAAVPTPGHTLEELEKAIGAEIAALQSAPPTPEELARIKTRVVADEVFQQDSVFYQAMVIGSLEAVGLDWRIKDDYVERIKAVTPEQVQAVARKYLTEDRLTVAHLLPVAKGDADAH